MHVRSKSAATAVAVLLALAACSSSGSGDKPQPPSCSDTSAKGTELARGCKQDDTVYKAIVTHCADGRVMYNVPSAPPSGVSAFSDGKLRTHAVSPAEVVRCQTGGSPTP